MSESLLFAILGFLIACLFGTVFASFLWRRAVTVTKRRLGLTSADRDSEADTETLAEMQELRRRLGERDLQVRNLKSKTELQNQDRAENEAEARDEVKRQLSSAARELEKAAAEKARLAAELAVAEARTAETETALIAQSQRVDTLEAAIRTLVTSANLSPLALPIAPEEVNEPREWETEPTSDARDDENKDPNFNATTADETNGDAGNEPAEQADEADRTLVAAASQSLDDRIQALMQGQKPH
ncbi:MAG: hypothetical protein RLN89_03615 [Parvibaculum sp.]